MKSDSRRRVWNVPCDAIFILINAKTYGGGGIYNFYAMGTADNERTNPFSFMSLAIVLQDWQMNTFFFNGCLQRLL